MAVDVVTMAETMDRIRQFLGEEGFHLVVTADSSMLVDAQTDAELAKAIKQAALVTPDSAGVLWASARRGVKIGQKVSGVDIVAECCKLSATEGTRLYFLGAEPGLAELAAERLKLLYPGCQIVGARHGYFPKENDSLVAQEVAEARPDILFVAMGIPRQEKFLVETASIHGAKVGIGVGGSLDVYSGRAKRAPVIFQKLKLEWLYRTLQNPKKWRKTMKLPQFMWMVLRSKN